jgi:hypothetical protein
VQLAAKHGQTPTLELLLRATYPVEASSKVSPVSCYCITVLGSVVIPCCYGKYNGDRVQCMYVYFFYKPLPNHAWSCKRTTHNNKKVDRKAIFGTFNVGSRWLGLCVWIRESRAIEFNPSCERPNRQGDSLPTDVCNLHMSVTTKAQHVCCTEEIVSSSCSFLSLNCVSYAYELPFS